VRKLSKEEIIKRARIVHGDKYDYSLVDYINSRTNINIICDKHGIFSQNPRHHIEKKSQCPECRNEKLSKEFSLDTNDFIKQAVGVHGDNYDYSNVIYVNGRVNVIIGCKKHGNFNQIPFNHLNGAGCPACKESFGEKKIGEYLSLNNICFQRQVSFNGLKGDKNLLKFDFYLPEYKLLIEYDGIQHYKIVNYFGGKNKFLKQKEYDWKKIKFVMENGYKLLKLPYTTINYLEEALECELKNLRVLC
jgi:very-short-patch-repair endonuclease